MNLKRLLWFAFLAFSIFFVVQSPVQAGRLVQMTGETAGVWLSGAAESFAKFVKTFI